MPQLSHDVRVGLIGAGGIAPAHVLSLRAIPWVTIAGVSDSAGARAQSLASEFGIPKAYDSYVEMLKDERLDVVHVLTPPDSHVAIALDAIRTGSDAFVEKPLGVNTRECRLLKTEADRLGRTVGVNHSDAHAPAFCGLLDVVASRRLGRVNHMAVTYAAPPEIIPTRDPEHFMFRSPGNMILEFGPHPFSMIFLVMGQLKDISASVTGPRKVAGGQIYYHTLIFSMNCARGTAQLIISVGRGLKEITSLLLCQDGMAFADSTRGVLRVYENSPYLLTEHLRSAIRNGLQGIVHAAGSVLEQSAVKLKLKPFSTQNGFSSSIASFYRARRHGCRIVHDGATGMEVVRYCEEATISCTTRHEGIENGRD